MIKTTDLRPCDCCGGGIYPTFYVVKVNLVHMMVDRRAVGEVLGLTLVLENLGLGEFMSPGRPAAVEIPGSAITKELFICQKCITGVSGAPFVITPIGLIMEHEARENQEAPS